MTADTRPVAQEAAARLRQIVKPGDTLHLSVKVSRSGRTCSLRVFLIESVEQRDSVTKITRRITRTVADACGFRLIPQTGALVGTPQIVLDRLSVALFGEPGQIKGEYL